jgi:PST family polysaccharide transporter
MYDRIREYWRQQHIRSFFTNSLAYSFFQVTNYIIPLLVIPYIVRVIGPDKYGILSIALAVIYYINIVTDYSFDISATKTVAQQKHDLKRLSSLYSSIFAIKIVISAACFLLLWFLLLALDVKQEFTYIYLFTYLLIPGNIALSLWFYVALEKTYFATTLNFIARILYLAGIFLFVRNSDDYVLIPFLNGISLILAGLISIYFLLFKIKLRPKLVSYACIRNQLREGKDVFLANLFINFYHNANVLILQFFVSDTIVGIYSAGEKIIKLLQSLFVPVSRVFYPLLSRVFVEDRNKALRYFRKVAQSLGILSLAASLALSVFGLYIADIYLGNEFSDSGDVIMIAAFAVLFGTLNYLFGIVFMLNLNQQKLFLKNVLVVGISNIVLCTILSYSLGANGAAISFLAAEMLLLVLLLNSLWRNHSLNELYYA